MSDKKMKVKDLATELGLPNKDILSAAKEVGVIGAKAAASNLTDAEVVKLREHITGPTEPEKPEVIIRRRRPTKATAEEAVPAVEAESIAEKPTEVSEKEPVVVADEPVKAAKAEAQPKDKAVQAEAPTPKKQPTPKKEPAPAARIIRPATPPVEEKAKIIEPAKVVAKPLVEATKPLVSKEPAVIEATTPEDDDKTRPAVFSAEPEKDARGATISSAPAPAPARDEDASEDSADVSSVRVISRPAAPVEKKAVAPKVGERQERTFAPRPPRAAQGAPREEGRQVPPGMNVPAPESEQGRKKRSKGRRTVEFGARSSEREDFNMMRSTGKRKSRNRKEQPLTSTQPMKAGKRVIKVEEFIRVSDLAHQMGLKSGEIIKSLFALGVMATINQSLDIDTATLIANEFDYEVEKVGFFEEDALAQHRVEDVAGEMQPRPPVVTIMGHVDHGKTSLLDALRKATVASGEAGGITQHIGAYHVKTPKGEIVFLDTPGHEAFTAMRARGAEVTDIVVLVVAADDGVMEQTREAISHAKAAKVPIMVAVNKMDKEQADPDRVKRELAEQGLVAEDWGGDVTFSYVSAKTRQGLDELLELLALQAEILELKANPSKEAMGHIVEAKLDKGRGALGTVLITSGTLRQGDAFVCGIHAGRVRAMFNDQGKKVKEAGPSMPVEVQGFEGVPMAGDEFFCLADEKTARRIAEARALKQRERELAKESKITLETFLASRVDDVEAVVLNLVVKADVQGSLEAIIDALVKLSTEKVRINVMHGGAGAISESDVLLAAASNAIIIGFNVRPTAKAKELAEAEKVDMRFYDVIYKLVEEITNAMEGMLAPIAKEVYLGVADVRETFSVPKIGMVAGCHVSDGKLTRTSLARLLRDGVVIYTGKIDSLRRFKDDVREVAKGYECGIGLENYNDIKVGDVIEAYEIVEEAAKL